MSNHLVDLPTYTLHLTERSGILHSNSVLKYCKVRQFLIWSLRKSHLRKGGDKVKEKENTCGPERSFTKVSLVFDFKSCN